MINFVLPGGEPFALYKAPPAPTDKEELSGPLALDVLEHGAYYAGRFECRPTIARWHAKKRRFIFGEHVLGRRLIRAASHIADKGTAEAFAPLSKTHPQGSVPRQRLRLRDCVIARK